MLEPGGNIEGKPEVEGVRSGKERRIQCVAVAVREPGIEGRIMLAWF